MVKLGKRFEQAMALAIELHGNQKRKFGKTPYISHLLCVVALVLQDGGDEEQAIAALLHDAVEDRGGRATLERIEKAFGVRVAGMVEACSDSMEWPKKPWRQRKESHLASLKDAPPEVCRIMLADKLCNTRSLLRGLREHGEKVWRSFNGGRDGSLWYFRQMHALLSYRAPGYIADELARVLEEIERFGDNE